MIQASEICNRANELRIFLEPGQHNAQIARLRSDARQWIEEVERCIDLLTPSEALPLAAQYDFVHRVAYDTPADTTFLNRHYLRAFRAMTKGDNKVDKDMMYRIIDTALRRRDPAFFSAPLKWHSQYNINPK